MSQRKYGEIKIITESICVVTSENFEPSLEEFRTHLNDIKQAISQPNKAIVIDLSNASFLPSSHRIVAGEWLKDNQKLIRQNVKGMVFVVNSVIVKVMMKGIFLISPPPVDHVVVSNLDSAMEWATEKSAIEIKK